MKYEHREGYVMVTITGAPTIEQFLGLLQRAGADSVGWAASAVLVDLRGVTPVYSFTEQLRIGQTVAMNLGHLRKVAAVVPPERITRVGEKAARHSGATVQVFAEEAEAERWFTSA
jgi:hypothetical protein